MADRRRKKNDIEEAKKAGQKALEDAKAGRIQRVESENEVQGFAEIPYLQGGNSNFGDTSPSVAIDTPKLPTVQQMSELSRLLQEQNASRNAQRRTERDRLASLEQSQSESVPMSQSMGGYGPNITSGTLDRRGTLSENGQKEVDRLNKRIESLQRIPMTGDAAIDEVTQSNNQSEIADLQRQIDSIYETDNSERSANVDRYLDSNRKLSKYEKNEANAIFEEYLNNNPKAKELYNTNDAAMSSLLAQRFTPDEAEEYAKMITLKNKISRGQSAGLHATESMPFVKGLADKSTEKYGERIGKDLSDYDYSSQLEQTQTQNPLASTAGNMAYQLGSYAAFAPLLEGIPVVGKAAEKVGGLFSNPAVGEAAANIVRGQAADTILDTLPNEVLPDVMEGNWRDLPKDILLNQAGNLAFNLGGEAVGALANRVIPYLRNADEVADTVKQNEIDPADLARQNEIDVNEKVDNVNQAVDEINNLAEQIPQSSMDPAHELAGRYAATYEAFNDYDAMDQVYEADSFIEGMADDIANGRDLSQYIDALEENIDDAPDEEIRANMQTLIDELKRVNESKGIERSAEEAVINATPANRDLENRIRQNISDLEMSPETRSAVEDSMKTFDDLLERIDNAQSQEEIEALMAEAERIGRDADNLLKGGAQSRLIAKNQFDEDTRSFVNAINGTTIKVPDNLRGEFPDQTLKQLQQRLHFYGEGKNYGANLRKGSGTPIESLFEDIDNATGHALSSFMESQGYNIDSPEGQLKALIEYADALKANQNTSKVMDYNGGIFDDWYQEMVDRSVKRNGELRQLANQMDGAIPARSEVPSASRQTVDDVTETVTPETTNVPPVNNGGDEPVIELTQGGNGDARERGMSQHVRGEDTPMKVEGVSDEVQADFVENPDMYKQLKNADTQALADDIYKSGDQTISINGKVYRGDLETKFRALLEDKNPASLPLGHQLAKDYSAAGNHDMAAQIYRDMGKELTKAGQFSQASVLAMMKNDPLTAMQYAQKELSAINMEGAKKFGEKWKDMSLTPEEIQAFNSITPGDTDAIKALYDKIGARLGKEYPTTFMEKLLEGRKVAMLFNLRTNVRNFGANIPTLGLRWVSDRLAAVGEGAIHLINPKFARTQAVTGSGIQGRKLASEIFSSPKVQALLDGTAGKYEVPELKNTLMKDRQMFKGTPVSKWINKVTNGGIEKANKKLFGKEGVESGLETIRNTTYKMLDLGDSPFVRENFIERLGSYIHANKIKNVDDVPEEAIQMAWEEAMKATYKDNSWAVQMLRGIKTQGIEKIPGIGKPLSQALIPFLQAPGNIAARMVDYSPIKATKGIADIIAGAAKKNEAAVRKGIDEAAKGLTGSGLIVLGMKLREAGLITGDYSEDKDQKNFEKQNGFIPWALHIGDKYFQYDWAQPFAEPLIVGTLLQDAIDKSDQYDSDILNYFGVDNQALDTAIGVTKEGTKAAINSWFNASPLQGLAEIMSGGYNGTDIAQNLFDAGVGDFAGALIPSLVNASAKTADTTQRQAYDPSNTFASFVNQQKAKIPGLSDNLSAKYDTFGNEMKYADSNAEAFAQRFLIPGNYGTDTNDPIDIAINDLFNETQDARVFPTTAPNSVSGIKLTAQDVSDYQRDMGQRSRQIVEAFINSDLFKSLDNDEKVSALNEIYGTSKAITERNLFNKSADNSDYKKAIEAYDTDKEAGVLEHLSSKYNKYGIDAKAYREMVENGEDLTPYEGYKEARASLDIDDNAAYRNAYASGNTPEEKIANLQNEMEYQNTCKEVGIDPDGKAARAAWDKALHASGDPVAALQQVAQNRENALNLGFVKEDGTVNQASYDKAVNVLGDDPDVLSNYVSFKNNATVKGNTKIEQYIPMVEAIPGLTYEQKGQFAYLYGGEPTGKSAKAALGYGYDAYFLYRLLQDAPDLNDNGKAHDTGDRIKYLYSLGYGADKNPEIYNLLTGPDMSY